MNKHRQIPSAIPATQKGSSLLEVLVAVLIMSFGLLALGGRTAASQQYVKMAQFQSIGMTLASDLSERMRGNVSGFQQKGYDHAEAYSTAAITVPGCKVAGACTVTEMAALDLAEWLKDVRLRLPGGDAYVERSSTNVLAADIWILWVDPNIGKLAVGVPTDCPAKAVSGRSADMEPLRCMYYRVSL